MMQGSSHWQIDFYTDSRGKCDVLEYINALQETERAQIVKVLRLLEELGLRVRMPHARPLAKHKPLWELRPGANRVIYFAHSGRRFIMLHAFRKKGRKTPRKHIAIAENRMYDFLERENEP